MTTGVTTGVKICGITRLEDGLAALDAGAVALGFVLAEGSPRELDAAAARSLVSALRAAAPRPFEAVAVLGTCDPPTAREALTAHGFDRVQIHGAGSGGELAHALLALGELAQRAWGAVRVKDAASFEGLAGAVCEAFLLDRHSETALGGTGEPFDWGVAVPFAARHRIVLAGGLRAENVAAAIRRLHPWRVDVSSGVEDAPGIKSAAKIRAFVEAAHHA